MLAVAARFHIFPVRVRPYSYLASERYELLVRLDFEFFDYPLALRDDAAFGCRRGLPRFRCLLFRRQTVAKAIFSRGLTLGKLLFPLARCT